MYLGLLLFYSVVALGVALPRPPEACDLVNDCASCLAKTGCMVGINFDEEFECYGFGQEFEFEITRRILECKRK